MLFRKTSRRRTDPNDAERILVRSLDALRQHQPGDTTPLPLVRARVNAKAAQQASWKDSHMSRATYLLTAHPKTGLTVITAVAILLLMTLVPLPYTKTVGYNVSFTDIGNEISVDPNQIVAALSTLGYDHVTANFNSDGVRTVWDLKGLPDQQAAMTAAAAFRALTEAEIEPVITPVKRRVSGTLYAQVREHLQQITISVDEAASPAEIEAQIRAQLIAAGFEPANVRVITNTEDSTIFIDLEVGQ
ncbi:MAG: hypothetical protein JSU74_13025 [Candidatus Zixiibacteriota bacterium]|nr:MAG: hypothetical protein JSU74_13025 [candidate division Zixibacteria bacterium]